MRQFWQDLAHDHVSHTSSSSINYGVEELVSSRRSDFLFNFVVFQQQIQEIPFCCGKY